MIVTADELNRALRRMAEGVAKKAAARHPSLKADGAVVADTDGKATIGEYGTSNGDETGAMLAAVKGWNE